VVAIIITGNPVDGFTIVGPFENRDEAFDFGNWNLKDEEWWVDLLIDPASLKAEAASQ
jgi:hypothetical protein